MKYIVMKKIICTFALASGCFLIGLIANILNNDKVLFIMSIIISICFLIRTFILYSCYKNKKYVIVEGKCIEISKPLFSKFKTVKVESEGRIITINLQKNDYIELNENYILYFSKKPEEILEFNNSYITMRLNSENLIGYEKK